MKIAGRKSIIGLLNRRAQDPGGGTQPSGNNRVIRCRNLREPTVAGLMKQTELSFPEVTPLWRNRNWVSTMGSSSQQGALAPLTVRMKPAVGLEVSTGYDGRWQ